LTSGQLFLYSFKTALKFGERETWRLVCFDVNREMLFTLESLISGVKLLLHENFRFISSFFFWSGKGFDASENLVSIALYVS